VGERNGVSESTDGGFRGRWEGDGGKKGGEVVGVKEKDLLVA